MWNERFLFVLSVLFTIGMWIAFGLKRNAQRSRKSRKFANYLAYAIVAGSGLIIAMHLVYYL
jgi:NO-binding membrane sensor protein with MHYT domain